MKDSYRRRRVIMAVIVFAVTALVIMTRPELTQQAAPPTPASTEATGQAVDALARLPVKGRAPKTGYERTQFGEGWQVENGCDTRNRILQRDMQDAVIDENCRVASGTLHDPYGGKDIAFVRGADTSQLVQIDHVVALSNAWQTGAQLLSTSERIALANDPLELLAVDGELNQEKSDGDAATWLPPNKPFRCQYVARQIAVKGKYRLWVTAAEKDAMLRVLSTCPGQQLPQP